MSRIDLTRVVGILIYEEAEVLDVAGPFEVFSVANRVALGRLPELPPPFAVSLVGRDGRAVQARGGFEMAPHHTLSSAPAFDVFIVPGGVSDAVEHDRRLTAWLRDLGTSAEVIASVCTGAFVLAAAGLLDGRTATTHWEDAADLARRYPGVRVEPDRRWIDHGRVATSAGISAGIDLALHLVARLTDEDLARATARQMDYLPVFPDGPQAG